VSDFYLLSFDGIDDTQRGLIQALLSDVSEDWWHQQSNTWIVRVDDLRASTLRDLFKPIIHQAPANVLVVGLDPKLGWGTRAPSGSMGGTGCVITTRCMAESNSLLRPTLRGPRRADGYVFAVQAACGEWVGL